MWLSRINLWICGYSFFFLWGFLNHLLSTTSRFLASQVSVGTWKRALHIKEVISLSYTDALRHFISNNPHEVMHLDSAGDQCYTTGI